MVNQAYGRFLLGAWMVIATASSWNRVVTSWNHRSTDRSRARGKGVKRFRLRVNMG